MIVGVYRVEGKREVFGATAQHAPHIARLRTAQVDEDRVGEAHVLGVTASHGLGIELLEGAVETLDQFGVGVAHGSLLRALWFGFTRQRCDDIGAHSAPCCAMVNAA